MSQDVPDMSLGVVKCGAGCYAEVGVIILVRGYKGAVETETELCRVVKPLWLFSIYVTLCYCYLTGTP